MEHEEALQRSATERYLLQEMSEAERSEFEAHYFDCVDCAADVRATAAFLATVRKELGKSRPRAGSPKPAASPPARSAWLRFLWQPAFAGPAFAALLLVTFYQGAIVLPRVNRENARLKAPEVLTPLSLIGANSRGGGPLSIAVTKGQSLLVSLDIPASRYPAYTCVLRAPGGAEWRLPVSADQARDTVAIRVPAAGLTPGEYQLTVQGQPGAGAAPVDLAGYRFTLTGIN